MTIPPLVQSVTEKLPDGMQKFDHSQVHVHRGEGEGGEGREGGKGVGKDGTRRSQ